MEYPEYGSYANDFLSRNALGELYVGFAKIHWSDGEARFALARDALAAHDMLPRAAPGQHERRRELFDRELAVAFRSRGNACYKAGDYDQAVNHYTESLLVSEPGGECHAFALANRSAALHRLGRHRLCVDDARRALRSAYPAGAAHKLHERAGDANRALRLRAAAEADYAECLESARSPAAATVMSAAELARLEARVADALRECRELPADAAAPADAPPPVPADPESSAAVRPLGGPHHLVPALSKHLELGSPRGLYAACDINPGDVVAVEQPYVCGPSQPVVCHYSGCLKPSITVIPCTKCSLAFYCNEECLQKALGDGHKIECPVLFAIRKIPGNTKINELALKWFLKECTEMGIEKYCSAIKNFDPQTKGFDENGQLKSDNFLSSYSMKSLLHDTSLDIMLFFNCIAVEILEFLMLSGFKISKSHFKTVGASLVRMLRILDINSRRLYFNNPSLTFLMLKDLTYPIAYALYPSIGLFNHSCDPNVKRSGLLSDKTRVLKAVQTIPKGSQLFVSYGVFFEVDDKITRISYCKLNFNFECTCQPCLENWPVGRFIPDRISALNLINPEMANTVTLEYKKFLEFKKKTLPNDFHKHLDYLYSFIKFMFANVKRPFRLYEDCLEMISIAHLHSNENDYRLIAHFFPE